LHCEVRIVVAFEEGKIFCTTQNAI
jgi:hypothetical protein